MTSSCVSAFINRTQRSFGETETPLTFAAMLAPGIASADRWHDQIAIFRQDSVGVQRAFRSLGEGGTSVLKAPSTRRPAGPPPLADAWCDFARRSRTARRAALGQVPLPATSA